MATVIPFKAVRPSRDKVALVSSKSYEAYTPAELGAKLDFNPYTFLHIINPGYKYHQEITGNERFQMVHERYEEFKEHRIFVQDQKPAFYLYESSDAHHVYCGIIAATSVNDYQKGYIKKHEGTIQQREILFENYLKATGFNAEPVLLTYPDNQSMKAFMEQKKKERPEYEFSTTDKKLHTLWIIDDQQSINFIVKTFEEIGCLYIADGHHRTASSALLAKHMAEEHVKNTGQEPYHFFMSYLIPESDLKIYEFNRFVKDLNGHTKDEFLARLTVNFSVENKGQQLYKPSKKHHFSMYLNGEFYSLYLRKESYNFTDELSALDTEILYQTILKPILGIEDVNNNSRLGYTNNTLDALSLKTNVDNGNFAVGFGMIPITVDEMKKIADAKLKMPPKTSYIEPKLRSGLIMYEF